MAGARRSTLWRIARTVALFALLVAPWWARVADSVPADDVPQDGWLIFWVLDWCWYALTTAPTMLFDPPVNFPAPAQLGGSEHFLSSQLVYGPLRVLTGNAAVAANLTAFLCYPLAAAAMEALLLALGVATGPAFAVSIVYGLGFMVAPVRLHILQSQHLYLPLVLLALHRLRERPTWGRALALGVAYAAGLLSSYHMAVYLTLAALVWGAAELARTGPERARYALRGGLVCAVGALGLLALSRPYFARPEAAGEITASASRWALEHLALTGEVSTEAFPPLAVVEHLGTCLLSCGDMAACFVAWFASDLPGATLLAVIAPSSILCAPLLLAGLLTWPRRARDLRVLLLAALAIAVVGIVLAGPEHVQLGSTTLALPSTWIHATPARFIRARWRALALTYFGGLVVVAFGLDAVQGRFGRWLGGGLALALVALGIVRTQVALDRWSQSPGSEPQTGLVSLWSRLAPAAVLHDPALDRNRDVYHAIAEHIRRTGPAPLLEWPGSEGPSALIGQTIHRQPSASFYSGYEPAHVLLVRQLSLQLTDPAALDDLVDMTGLGWILLRPASDWNKPEARDAIVQALTAHPRTVGTTAFGDFLLVRLQAASKHPEWFAAIADGSKADRTVLGSPLAPLPQTARGFDIIVQAPSVVFTRQAVRLRLGLVNLTPAALPAALPSRSGTPLSVHFEIGWRRAGDDGAPVGSVQVVELRRDVPPADLLEQRAVVAGPDAEGEYELVVAVRQVDGTDLGGPHNPARATVRAIPPDVFLRRGAPSFLLVVLDTVRFDAVSANGAVAGTTPTLDALAASGLYYTRAYANASWTLPSHASLFTGLLPDAHGVGWSDTWASDDLVMLAERLRDAGWDTYGISENVWVGGTFNMAQGFRRFAATADTGVGTEAVLRDWLGQRRDGRPFFLFVNIIDAHAPYRVRDENPWVPCCPSEAELRAVPDNARSFFCRIAEHADELAIQHGLYLGGVASADRKLGRILAILHEAQLDTNLVSVVTSDHGEHFGEHGLVDHLIGLHEELVHVPLVVHGLPDVTPAVVEDPVSLVDVVPSMLAWAGLPPAGTSLAGHVLARADAEPVPERLLVATWEDAARPPRAPDRAFAPKGRLMVTQAEKQCRAVMPTTGTIRMALRPPFKLYWREGKIPALYDLARDPGEARDLAAARPEILRALSGELAAVLAQQPPPPPPVALAAPPPDDDVLERLRGLGYVDGGED